MSGDDLKSYSKNELIREVRRLRGTLAAAGGDTVGDEPRVDRGTFLGPNDDPHARHSVVIDMRNGVLVDSVDVSAVEPYSDGEPQNVAVSLLLGGRVNKTGDRAEHLYLMPPEGAADIIGELVGLATRIGPKYTELILDSIDVTPKGRP